MKTPVWLPPLGWFFSVVSVLMLAVTVLSGFLGPDDPRENPAPVLVYVGLWLVFPFLSALIGDSYRVFAPWRVLSRWMRLGEVENLATARRFGYWPAAVVLLVFSWWELVSPVGASPAPLAVAAVVYTVYMLVSTGLQGRDTQLTTWDGFGAYNHLMGAMGPIGLDRDGVLVRRGWLRGLPSVAEKPGLDALCVVLIGGVTYDGLAGIPFWRNQLAGPLEEILVGMGLGWLGAEVVVGTFALLAVVALIGWLYHIACALSIYLSDSQTGIAAVRSRFAHTLAPIALAYAFAHYFTLVVYEGQFFVSAISDPFDLGWDLFGSAERAVNYTLIPPTAVWYIQLVAVIAGHVGGVILAHDRALTDFRGPDAVRSQYAMLALMVLLTMIALSILTSG